MIEIFQQIPDISTGVLKVPNWPFIARGISNTVEVIEQYYKENIRPVKANHILVKLLHSLAIPTSLALDRYYANVDSIALGKAMTLRMTSALSRGDIFRGDFYSGNTPEVLIASDNSFNPEYVDKNWMNIASVSVLMQPNNDFNYTIPNGKQLDSESGLAVIYINVPMLAIQYRAFVNHCLNNNLGLNATHFIGGYILPNMLRSQTSSCLFNRIYNTLLGLDVNYDTRRKHPVVYVDYRNYLDNSIEKIIDYLKKSNMKYRTILHTLPSVYKDSMYYDLVLPRMIRNRQLSWAMILSRLKVFDFMIQLAGKDFLKQNQMEYNYLIRSLKLYDAYNVFRDQLPVDIYFYVEEYLNRIYDLPNQK